MDCKKAAPMVDKQVAQKELRMVVVLVEMQDMMKVDAKDDQLAVLSEMKMVEMQAAKWEMMLVVWLDFQKAVLLVAALTF